jgi:hypothetical protein
MKTQVKISGWISKVILLLVLIPGTLFSQQIIRFKSGHVYEIRVISQSKDTVRYTMDSSPHLILAAPVTDVDSVWSSKELYPGYETMVRQQELQRKINKNTAVAVIGGVFTAVGIGLLVYGGTHDFPTSKGGLDAGFHISADFYYVLGGMLSATGFIMVLAGATNAAVQKSQLKRLTLDLNCTPSVQGITLRYKF